MKEVYPKCHRTIEEEVTDPSNQIIYKNGVYGSQM